MTKKSGNRSRFSFREFFRSPEAARMLICFLGMAVIIGLFEVAIVPMRYHLAVGMVPTTTISATKDVVDEASTEQRRREAANQVAPTYRYQEGVTEQVMSDFDQIFAQLRAVRQYAEMISGEGTARAFAKEELQYAHGLLSLINLSDYQLTSLMRCTKSELEEAYTLLYAALQSTMQGHVTQGQESTAVYNIRQIVNFRVSIPLGQNVIPSVLNACIQANMLVDQEATEAAKEAAREAVEPVVYKQGQNIVVRGQGRITANQLAMLSALGLLSDSTVDLTIYLGAALLVALTLIVMLALLKHSKDGPMESRPKILLMFSVLVITLALSLLARLANSYLTLTVLGALLMTSLLGAPTGIICNAALTILVAAVAAGGSEEYAEKMVLVIVSGLLSGTAAALLISRKSTRAWVLLSGFAAAAIVFLTIFGIGLMTSSELSGSLTIAAWMAGGAVVSTLLCIGVQPLLEMIFNLPTPMKLMELSNPNQPLLRRLLLEAPGTYHHCTIVASLAEAAAEAVGANPLLARVGGYYHDIGKLKRPAYFTENQTGGVNAHDHVDPFVSAAIITSHTRDGVALAKAYRLPEAVQDIIAQHHGNTPVMFFYHKALQQANGNPVDINTFRYDGHPPTTKEGAIVMLCDTIEAAVRTMKNPTPEGIDEFIVKLVRGKLEDGQLSDSPLTLRDIERICAAASQVLVGVFHERIEYPDMDELKAQLQATRTTAEIMQETDTVPGKDAAAMLEDFSANPPPMVAPVGPSRLVTVEPISTAKPVRISELVTIEPLPTKDMERELLEKEKAESGEEQPREPEGEKP